MTNPAVIFWPVLLQILLTLSMYVLLLQRKKRAFNEGRVDEARRALHEDAWPDEVVQVNNNIRNQFHLPVLFYVICIMLWALQHVYVFTVILAWMFVFSRIVHAWVHVGSNYVPLRRRMFTFGVVMLFGLMVGVIASLLGI